MAGSQSSVNSVLPWGSCTMLAIRCTVVTFGEPCTIMCTRLPHHLILTYAIVLQNILFWVSSSIGVCVSHQYLWRLFSFFLLFFLHETGIIIWCALDNIWHSLDGSRLSFTNSLALCNYWWGSTSKKSIQCKQSFYLGSSSCNSGFDWSFPGSAAFAT